ncbi:MAG: response regulator transcription factor [Candidatus Gracilibacteria bacterium]|nr:response regulator transcription factor [Candidatus Gracilibacteria bacterium]
MNILIIEDDVFFAEKIGKIFESKIITNRVQILHSFKDFIQQISSISSYDIVLVDIKLGPEARNTDGFEIIKIIRNKGLKLPIVVISGNSEIDGLRYAFELGVNDYIIKPIRLKELEIRVFNWFKNYYLSNISFLGKIHYYKNLSYNIDTNEFYYNQNPIPLTKNNKYILSIFFANPEKLLSESFLVEKIWGDFYLIVNRNLRVNILRLKEGLRPFGIDDWICNIRGEGYLLKAKF